MYRKNLAFVVIAVAAFALVFQTVGFAKTKKTAKFTVRVENVSNGEQVNSSGTKYPFALSPGLFVVSEKEMPLFSIGRKASAALESQAEDGNPKMLSDSLVSKVGSARLGVFNKPLGSEMPAPILPGQAYEFDFVGTEGQKLTLAAMFGQSNDLFYAPAAAIELFVGDKPFSGDITDSLVLWDAGTEVNQEPGTGADQAPRQAAPNTGMKEKGVVRQVVDGFKYPATNSVLRVTVTAVSTDGNN
jgi:hypothetical protein